MRLPLAVSLTSRDGTLAKDSLIKNGLVEGNTKVSVVRSRPGVTDLGLLNAGTARLLTCWNGLLSVISSSLASVVITENSSVGTTDTDVLSTGATGYAVEGIGRVGDKFYVSLWYEDATVIILHFYGNHSSGFVSSTALPSTLSILQTANSADTVVATVADCSADPMAPQYSPYLYKAANTSSPSFILSLTATSGYYFYSVVYLGGMFIALANNAVNTIVYVSSDNGVTWSTDTISGAALAATTYDGSIWWFYGPSSVAYSTQDFVTYTSHVVTGLSSIVYDAVYHDGLYRVMTGTSFVSTDGVTFNADTLTYLHLWQEGSAAYGVEYTDASHYTLYRLGLTDTALITFLVNHTLDGIGNWLSICGKDTLFCAPDGVANNSVMTITIPSSGTTEAATPTPEGTLADLYLSAEASGAAQSQQELLIKSAYQLWQYTQSGGLVLVTDIDYPGHHAYTASSVTRSGSTATFNTTVANALEAGMSVVVAGATQAEYNGTHTIATIVDADTFTYAVTGTPATPATGTITVYGGKTTVPGIVFLDGYFFVMTDKGVIYNSALGDGTSWNALDFVTAAEEPGAGVALGKSANYLVALKEWSTEPFYDAGNATGSPISPVKSMSTRVGCASGSSLVDVDDKLIWISQTKDKGRSVHVMQGLQQQTPVATPDVERVLELDDLASVSAYGLRIAGHVLYVLTLHTSAITLVYDLTSGVWYQWTSLTADTPLSVTSMTRSGTTVTVVTSTAHGRSDGDPVLFAGADQSDYNGRFNVAVVSSTSLSFQVDSNQATTATGTITATTYTEGHFAYTKHVYCSGRHLLLHESNGHLYEFTDEAASDALAPIDLRCRTGKVDNGNAESKRLASLEVVGHKIANGLALVRWTDDDYTSWSTYRSVDLEQEYSRIRRCGDFSRRAFELRYTGDAKVVLGAFELDVKG